MPSCRDTAELQAMNFSGVVPGRASKGTVKATVGSARYADSLRRRLDASRDVVIAGDDGIVIVPKAQAAEGPPLARRAKIRKPPPQALGGREVGVDIYAMREPLAKAETQILRGRGGISQEPHSMNQQPQKSVEVLPAADPIPSRRH